jgi:hypothetical protein
VALASLVSDNFPGEIACASGPDILTQAVATPHYQTWLLDCKITALRMRQWTFSLHRVQVVTLNLFGPQLQETILARPANVCLELGSII